MRAHGSFVRKGATSATIGAPRSHLRPDILSHAAVSWNRSASRTPATQLGRQRCSESKHRETAVDPLRRDACETHDICAHGKGVQAPSDRTERWETHVRDTSTVNVPVGGSFSFDAFSFAVAVEISWVAMLRDGEGEKDGEPRKLKPTAGRARAQNRPDASSTAGVRQRTFTGLRGSGWAGSGGGALPPGSTVASAAGAIRRVRGACRPCRPCRTVAARLKPAPPANCLAATTCVRALMRGICN